MRATPLHPTIIPAMGNTACSPAELTSGDTRPPIRAWRPPTSAELAPA